MTICRSKMDLLVREGIVERDQGSGTFCGGPFLRRVKSCRIFVPRLGVAGRTDMATIFQTARYD